MKSEPRTERGGSLSFREKINKPKNHRSLTHSSNCRPGHMTTFLGTATTGFGAALTMFLLVFAALLGAGIANVGTDATNLVDESRATAHEGDGHAAHFRAIEASSGTFGPVSQARIGAMVTLLSALTTCQNARLMLLVSHENLLLVRDWRNGLGIKGARMMPGQLSRAISTFAAPCSVAASQLLSETESKKRKAPCPKAQRGRSDHESRCVSWRR